MADEISVRKHTFSAMFKEANGAKTVEQPTCFWTVSPTYPPIRMNSGTLFFIPLNIIDLRM